MKAMFRITRKDERWYWLERRKFLWIWEIEKSGSLDEVTQHIKWIVEPVQFFDKNGKPI